MSAFSTLLALINAQIKTNGQKAITGAKLNGVLVQMVNELGSGYQFIDIATPVTDPGTPDENVWYIATQAGTYTNFGGIIVNENEVCALVWNGSWTKKVTGAATAAQVSQLGQKVNGITFVSGYIDPSGNLTPPDGRSQCTSELLPSSIVNGVQVNFDNSVYMFRLAYYDGNTFVGRSDIYTNSPTTMTTTYNVRITLMTYQGTSWPITDVVSSFTFSGLDAQGLSKRVEKLESDVDDISDDVNGIIKWTSGNIDSSGGIEESTKSNYYSQILDNNLINGMTAQVAAGHLMNLALYNQGVFVGRYGWIESGSGKVTIDTNYDARLMICLSTSDNTKSVEEVLSGIIIEGINLGIHKYVEDSLRSFEKLNDYLSKVQSCDFDGKILHFSFDDVCWCLYDLIQNEATYEDIFDEPFFAMLKEVHDSTGMVFTLNTFNEISESPSTHYPVGFDISDVPTKFQSNFQANKGWLKFAFHAKDEATDYGQVSGAGTDYGVFVSAIYTLTGDYDCIDHITRLGYFGGTKENCLALRDAEHGIIGFFGADDTRAYDYYLSSSQYAWLRKKGKYFDSENEMFFIKTQSRTFATGKQDVENNLCFQKVTEFFAHEYEARTGGTWSLTSMKNNILSLATWATGFGYKFEYPEKIYG